MKGLSLTLLILVTLSGAIFLFGASHPVFADQKDATYIGHGKCKICHNTKAEGEVWNSWKAMEHAKAYELLKGDEAKAVAEGLGLSTPAVEAPECLKCHVTAYDHETKKTPTGILLADGVQCESCHGPGSLHMADGQRKKKGEEVDTSANQTHPDVNVCITCHNDSSPTWKADRYTLEDGTKAGFDFAQAWEKIKHGPPKAEASE